MHVAAPALADLLRQLIQGYGGTQRDFAKAIRLSGSNLSHLVSGDPHYTLGVGPCLRIALVTHTSPVPLLQAAGKGDVAELLADLYGPVTPAKAARRPAEITPTDVLLIRRIRSLPLKLQRGIDALVEYNTTGRVPHTPRKMHAPTPPRAVNS